MQLRAPAATSMAIHDPGKTISNRTIYAALRTMIGIAPKFVDCSQKLFLRCEETCVSEAQI